MHPWIQINPLNPSGTPVFKHLFDRLLLSFFGLEVFLFTSNVNLGTSVGACEDRQQGSKKHLCDCWFTVYRQQESCWVCPVWEQSIRRFEKEEKKKKLLPLVWYSSPNRGNICQLHESLLLQASIYFVFLSLGRSANSLCTSGSWSPKQTLMQSNCCTLMEPHSVDQRQHDTTRSDQVCPAIGRVPGPGDSCNSTGILHSVHRSDDSCFAYSLFSKSSEIHFFLYSHSGKSIILLTITGKEEASIIYISEQETNRDGEIRQDAEGQGRKQQNITGHRILCRTSCL